MLGDSSPLLEKYSLTATVADFPDVEKHQNIKTADESLMPTLVTAL